MSVDTLSSAVGLDTGTDTDFGYEGLSDGSPVLGFQVNFEVDNDQSPPDSEASEKSSQGSSEASRTTLLDKYDDPELTYSKSVYTRSKDGGWEYTYRDDGTGKETTTPLVFHGDQEATFEGLLQRGVGASSGVLEVSQISQEHGVQYVSYLVMSLQLDKNGQMVLVFESKGKVVELNEEPVDNDPAREKASLSNNEETVNPGSARGSDDPTTRQFGREKSANDAFENPLKDEMLPGANQSSGNDSDTSPSRPPANPAPAPDNPDPSPSPRSVTQPADRPTQSRESHTPPVDTKSTIASDKQKDASSVIPGSIGDPLDQSASHQAKSDISEERITDPNAQDVVKTAESTDVPTVKQWADLLNHDRNDRTAEAGADELAADQAPAPSVAVAFEGEADRTVSGQDFEIKTVNSGLLEKFAEVVDDTQEVIIVVEDNYVKDAEPIEENGVLADPHVLSDVSLFVAPDLIRGLSNTTEEYAAPLVVEDRQEVTVSDSIEDSDVAVPHALSYTPRSVIPDSIGDLVDTSVDYRVKPDNDGKSARDSGGVEEVSHPLIEPVTNAEISRVDDVDTSEIDQRFWDIVDREFSTSPEVTENTENTETTEVAEVAVTQPIVAESPAKLTNLVDRQSVELTQLTKESVVQTYDMLDRETEPVVKPDLASPVDPAEQVKRRVDMEQRRDEKNIAKRANPLDLTGQFNGLDVGNRLGLPLYPLPGVTVAEATGDTDGGFNVSFFPSAGKRRSWGSGSTIEAAKV